MIDKSKNTQALDLSYLREMSGDSNEFMIEMLEAFLKQTPIYMADLVDAVKAENWKAVSEYAHKIKPTFYYIGREDAKEHMQVMERNAREGVELEKIPSQLEEAMEFVTILYKQLETAKASLQ
ncbi:MAG: Hpt domain-containing protein [Pedobacter sp.]|nr:MAG: Hpt domain-containing protein [Pedobacter sp.]